MPAVAGRSDSRAGSCRGARPQAEAQGQVFRTRGTSRGRSASQPPRVHRPTPEAPSNRSTRLRSAGALQPSALGSLPHKECPQERMKLDSPSSRRGQEADRRRLPPGRVARASAKQRLPQPRSLGAERAQLLRVLIAMSELRETIELLRKKSCNELGSSEWRKIIVAASAASAITAGHPSASATRPGSRASSECQGSRALHRDPLPAGCCRSRRSRRRAGAGRSPSEGVPATRSGDSEELPVQPDPRMIRIGRFRERLVVINDKPCVPRPLG